MLLLALGYRLIRTAEDFQAVGDSNEHAILLSDLELPADFAPVQLTAFVDGNNHSITASAPVFSGMKDAFVRNLTLVLKESAAITTTASNTTFHTVAFLSASNATLIRRLNGCAFKSVFFNGTSIFAEQSQESHFAGSSFISLQDNATAANTSTILLYSFQDGFVSTYLGAQLKIDNGSFVGGITVIANQSLFKGCRIVSNITAAVSYRVTIGGVAAYASTINITDCDVLATIWIKDVTGDIGGLFGSLYNQRTPNRTSFIQNSGVTANYSIQNAADHITTSYFYGGIIGQIANQNIQVLRVSTFLRITLNATNKNATSFGGIVGRGGGDTKYSYCYAFGQVQGSVKSKAVVGGIAATTSEFSKAEFRACTSNVVVNLEVGVNSTIGAFAGLMERTTVVRDCQTLGNIAVTLAESARTDMQSIGGFIGSALGTIENCYTSTSISVYSEIARTNLTVGGFIGYASGVKVRYSLVKADQILCSLASGQNLYLGGFVGVFWSDDVEFSESYALIVNAKLVVQTTALVLGVGGFAGYAGAGSISDVFVKASFGYQAHENASYGTFIGAYKANATVANAYAAVLVQDNATVGLIGGANKTFESLYADCSLAGNEASQSGCRADCKTAAFAEALGALFAQQSGHNADYPYLVNPAQLTAAGFQPSANKTLFPDGEWYTDAKGMLYPHTSFQICRSACHGSYASPNEHTCAEGASEREFCILMNGSIERIRSSTCSGAFGCHNGVSSCRPSEDLVAGVCTASCAACANGVCNDGQCVCQPFFTGDGCAVYNCSAAEPSCYGHATCDPASLQCACGQRLEYVDPRTGTCTAGCAKLRDRHAICVGDGMAYCRGAVQTVASCNKIELSAGAAAGIAAGGVVLVAAIVLLVVWLCKKVGRNPKLYSGVQVDRIVVKPDIQMI